VLVGVLLPVLTLAGYRRMRALDAEVVPTRQQLLLDDVPIFAPLSLAAKERLAVKLVPLEVPAGETIVRAGDVGDGDGHDRDPALRADFLAAVTGHALAEAAAKDVVDERLATPVSSPSWPPAAPRERERRSSQAPPRASCRTR
jgi:hypothetical protein